MIKRIFLTALFVVGTFLTSFANERKDITLNNNDHKSETIELAYCNIFVSLDVDENDNAEIAIELENKTEPIHLILFERAYDEKTLKKMSPSITYDKSFGGSKGKRNIDVCPDLKNTFRIKSSEKTKLFVKTGNERTPLICRLPIYFAKNKNKSGSKMLLLEKEVIELEIQVQLKPDEEYISITESFEALIKDIDSETFCTNKNHKGESLKNLKNKYEGKINDLKRRIKKIVEERDYYPSDKACEKFMEVSGKLDAISIDSKKVTSCGNDPIPAGPTCKYSNLSYKEIYERLNNYSIDIYNGKLSKSKVMPEVESLYKCAAEHTRHSKRKDNNYKSGITKCYNRIKSYK